MPGATSACTVSVGTRSRRQISGVFLLVVEAWRTASSGTVRPLGSGDLQVAQRRERERAPRRRARDDVDEIDVVAHLRDRRAGDDGVELLGERLRAQAEQARLVLVDADAHACAGSIQSKLTLRVCGFGADDLRDAEGDLAHLADVRPADAVLHRPADRRAELERSRRAPTSVGKSSASSFSSFACSRSRAATSFATITAWAKKSFGSCTLSGR